jgi:hypothetical protein
VDNIRAQDVEQQVQELTRVKQHVAGLEGKMQQCRDILTCVTTIQKAESK